MVALTSTTRYLLQVTSQTKWSLCCLCRQNYFVLCAKHPDNEFSARAIRTQLLGCQSFGWQVSCPSATQLQFLMSGFRELFASSVVWSICWASKARQAIEFRTLGLSYDFA